MHNTSPPVYVPKKLLCGCGIGVQDVIAKNNSPTVEKLWAEKKSVAVPVYSILNYNNILAEQR